MNRIVVGVDIAKRVFQLHWVERRRARLWRCSLSGRSFWSILLIGRIVDRHEACGGSQHWRDRCRSSVTR